MWITSQCFLRKIMLLRLTLTFFWFAVYRPTPHITPNSLKKKCIALFYSPFLSLCIFPIGSKNKNLFCTYRLSLKVLGRYTVNKKIFEVGLMDIAASETIKHQLQLKNELHGIFWEKGTGFFLTAETLLVENIEDLIEWLTEGIKHILMFLHFRTDRSGQTVQTQIRLLLEEQSDQGLHCLQFSLHLWDALF